MYKVSVFVGSSRDVAALQDMLVYALKGLSAVAVEGRRVGVTDDAVNHFTCEGVFSTLTNVSFDAARIVSLIHACAGHKQAALQEKVKAAGGDVDSVFSGFIWIEKQGRAGRHGRNRRHQGRSG